MKHIIISRCKFSDEKLMMEYVKISKQFFIPAIKSQLNTEFMIGLIINESHIELIKNELDIDFISFENNSEMKKYMIDNSVDIQTRHDIDDWMSNTYVDTLHKLYTENINKFDSFLIQSQPIKFICKTGSEQNLYYTNVKNSMHLTLCQNNVRYSIHERQHGQMFQIVDAVISIPHGSTKWVIHGNNITCRRYTTPKK